MAFQNPFILLSPREAASLASGGLPAIRESLLRQFENREGQVIEIKGNLYSREQVLAILDELERDLPFYLFINQVPFLVRFLQNQEPFFLHDKGARQRLMANPELKPRVDQLVAATISDMLPSRISQWNANTAKLLAGVQQYVSAIDPGLRSMAYAKALPVLEKQIVELRTNYPDAFAEPWNNEIHFALEGKIDGQALQFFQSLPAEFQHCREQIAAWCEDACLAPFRNRHASLGKFSKSSLQFIQDAANLASLEKNKLDNLKLAGDISRFRQAPSMRSRKTVLIVSAIIGVGLLRLWFVFHDVWDARDEYANAQEEGVEEVWGDRQEDNEGPYEISQSGPYTGAVYHQYELPRRGINPNRFNGGALLKRNEMAVRHIVDSPDTTNIFITCDIMPTAVGNFLQYIPAELKAKYADSERVFRLIFQKRGQPDIRFAHNLHASFGAYTKVVRGPRQVESADTIVTVQSIDPADYHFKGYLTQIDTSGQLMRETFIEVRHAAGGGLEQIFIDGSADGENASSQDQQMRLRVRSALKNIERLDDWTLLAGEYHDVGHLTTYAFTRQPLVDGQAEHNLVFHEYLQVDDRIRFVFQSESDGIAYFTGNHSNFDIKYMIDTKSNKVKGISMANLSQDLTTVERIELYRTDQ
jgi:hypothetical protein